MSFRSFGYIFIQTDKPIYNPGDTGKDCNECRTRRETKPCPSILDVVTDCFLNYRQGRKYLIFDVLIYKLKFTQPIKGREFMAITVNTQYEVQSTGSASEASHHLG